MICFSNTTEVSVPKKMAVTLGKFDGLHRGHQKLLQKILSAKESGCKTAVFTFASPPATLLTGKPQRLLFTYEERRYFLEQMGIDYLVEYPFNKEIAHLPPRIFVKEVLKEKLHTSYLAAGEDFGFGYRRAGNTNLLREMADECGYQIDVLKKEKDGQRDISSTYIKEELTKGNMEKVAFLLGRPFSIREEIIHGKELGRQIGIPTINMLPPDKKMLPPKGVYCARAEIDGKCWDGITNIGVKPTVTVKKVMTVETHLFSAHQNLYGKMANIWLYAFIRPEQEFSSVEELKAQMERDIITAKQYLNQ